MLERSFYRIHPRRINILIRNFNRNGDKTRLHTYSRNTYKKSVSTDTEIVSGEINQRTREQAPGSLERDRGFQLNERGGRGEEGFSMRRSHHRYLIPAFQSAIS